MKRVFKVGAQVTLYLCNLLLKLPRQMYACDPRPIRSYTKRCLPMTRKCNYLRCVPAPPRKSCCAKTHGGSQGPFLLSKETGRTGLLLGRLPYTVCTPHRTLPCRAPIGRSRCHRAGSLGRQRKRKRFFWAGKSRLHEEARQEMVSFAVLSEGKVAGWMEPSTSAGRGKCMHHRSRYTECMRA